ncbi:alpha-mannosidase [Lactobacillus hominis]|uniref:alpha-mannosidase n=1 Tax=Lactobacillus hominis TaxID=1203033 RepID=UPI0023F43580|nr:alpha-mannosidase [Lactobacillus hominis]
MKKKRVFIISHSHWDREWYMSFEEHHMRLVKLIDDLLYLFKHDPKFNSFHLDGQDIILDDYLAVRPEKRDEIRHWVQAGKLRVGPFYILQDDFLISPESNVRNTQYGMQKARQYGHAPVPVGYFPDTFGNMGQAPQIMKLAGLDTVAFGRGVTPTGLNNKVGFGKFDSTYSEMWWQGANKDKVLGILFANWYSNANEIPVDERKAKKFWDQKLADAEKFASTDDLLMMNGVDHQPVQMDLTNAIAVANKLYPDYEFIHSNFEDYIKALKKDLPKDLSTISGELTSQDTDGWYTLANTASSRIYMKQKNTAMERLLEDKVEPIYLLNRKIEKTDQDRLDYAWHELLRNHPHDSISGSGVDEVHRGMMNRYEKVKQVGRYLANAGLDSLAKKINTSTLPKTARAFLVINPADDDKKDEVKVQIEVHRELFAGNTPDGAYRKCEKYLQENPNYQLFDAYGKPVSYRIVKKFVRFGYELPERTFRIPYMASYVEVAFSPKMKANSWQTFYLDNIEQDHGVVVKKDSKNLLANDYLSAEVATNGEIKIFDQNHKLNSRMQIVDTGDIGNEYIYKQSGDGKKIIFDTPITNLKRESLIDGEKLSFDQAIPLPVSADELLKKEQEEVIDVTHRHAGRSKELREFKVHVELTLMNESKNLAIKISGNKQIKDHRLQAIFKTDIECETHSADSIFEVEVRNNKVGKNWKNPENPQHQQCFVSVHKDGSGIVVGNFGLNEYEVSPDGKDIAVTLLRCVGEMGDWGYFPTKDSQCQGDFTANLSVAPTDGSKPVQIAAYKKAQADQVKLITKQVKHQLGEYDLNKQYLKIDNPAFSVTATKVTPEGKMFVRGYNLTNERQDVHITLFDKKPSKIVDLHENDLGIDVDKPLAGAEIRTYEFE